MSGPPGIVYQTWRSIRSVHCWQFFYFNSRIMHGQAFQICHIIQEIKKNWTRKSWFKFLAVTVSKNKWLKITYISSWFCQRLFVSFLQISDLRILYLVRQADPHGANHRLPSFGPVELFGMAVNLHDSMSEECHTHLVSLIKHHGLFVPYIVTNFFLVRESWFSASYLRTIFFLKFENFDLAPHTCQPIQGWYRRETPK